MAEEERNREFFCRALGREVEVTEVFAIDGCGACGVSAGVAEVHCSGERECRRRGLYKDCALFDGFGELGGIG